MDDSSSGKILGKIGLAILVIALLDLGFLNWWIIKNDKFARNIADLAQRQVSVVNNKQVETKTDKEQAQNTQSELAPSPSPIVVSATSKETTTTKTADTVVQTAQKEIFIPLGSSFTKSQSYAVLSGLEVTIDPSKYSAIDSIVFQASVWVDGGNGRAWGELYVVDDKNLLIESQISNPTQTPTLMTSGHLPLPNGAKTYRVYAKTDLGDYAAHVDNARIKITLK